MKIGDEFGAKLEEVQVNPSVELAGEILDKLGNVDAWGRKFRGDDEKLLARTAWVPVVGGFAEPRSIMNLPTYIEEHVSGLFGRESDEIERYLPGEIRDVFDGERAQTLREVVRVYGADGRDAVNFGAGRISGILRKTDDIALMADWCVGPTSMASEIMSGKTFMRRIEEYDLFREHAGWEYLRRARRYLEHDYEWRLSLAGAWGALSDITMGFLAMSDPPDEVMIELLEGAAGVMQVYEVYFLCALERDSFRDEIWPAIPVKTAAGEWKTSGEVVHPEEYDDSEEQPEAGRRLAPSLELEVSDELSSEAKRTAEEILGKMDSF